jgi:GTP cyclohydrolase I
VTTAQGAAKAVRDLLAWIGEDPEREGLRDTPNRVLKSLVELTGGYADDPATILARVFDERSDQMVVVTGIRVVSLCEHHLLPFTGTAVVGYVPDGRVVGLSKLPRLVNAFARRLQVQERLTEQVADAIAEHLQPKGVGVLIRAHHQCMGLRGVQQPDALMTTSALRGVMLDKPEARAEFLALARNGHG